MKNKDILDAIKRHGTIGKIELSEELKIDYEKLIPIIKELKSSLLIDETTEGLELTELGYFECNRKNDFDKKSRATARLLKFTKFLLEVFIKILIAILPSFITHFFNW